VPTCKTWEVPAEKNNFEADPHPLTRTMVPLSVENAKHNNIIIDRVLFNSFMISFSPFVILPNHFVAPWAMRLLDQ
jgi:hypothetical protein